MKKIKFLTHPHYTRPQKCHIARRLAVEATTKDAFVRIEVLPGYEGVLIHAMKDDGEYGAFIPSEQAIEMLERAIRLIKSVNPAYLEKAFATQPEVTK